MDKYAFWGLILVVYSLKATKNFMTYEANVDICLGKMGEIMFRWTNWKVLEIVFHWLVFASISKYGNLKLKLWQQSFFSNQTQNKFYIQSKFSVPSPMEFDGKKLCGGDRFRLK